MSKEYTWDIELDGAMHHLLAVMDKRGSGYLLYDGDDYVANILPAVPFKMQTGIEQEFEIDGHRLLFVELTRYVPDIVYGGTMIGSGREYTKAKRSFCKSKLATYGIIMVYIILLMIWYGVKVRYGAIAGAMPLAVFVIYEIIKFARGLSKTK